MDWDEAMFQTVLLYFTTLSLSFLIRTFRLTQDLVLA